MDDDTLASGPPPRASGAAPGTTIGKYILVRTLGAGGMGVVWAARDPDLEREIAVKLLRGEDAGPNLRTRLLREARAMARLKHPNVLTVYEVGSDGGRDYIAMELVDGSSLDAWLREARPAREIWDALIAAGRGLAAAHAAGIVHRDFKPHNVLRSRDGRVLVTDFGLARGLATDALAATLPPDAAAGNVLDLQLTTTGQLLGTPAYMAPEQLDGGATDARTDQFAFCVTAWEALAGERPFAGTTLEQLRDAVRAGQPVATAKIPARVRAILGRGLSPDPARRWRDMPTLLAALDRARRTWPRRLAIAVPLVALAGGAAVFFSLHGGAAPATCEPADTAFAAAWTPEARADIIAKHPGTAALAAKVDAFAQRWHTGYAAACARTDAKRTAAIDCYVAQREQLAFHVDLLQRFPKREIGARELFDEVSASDPCSGADPMTARRLPSDARRAKTVAFLTKLYSTLGSFTVYLTADEPKLRAEAKDIGWPEALALTELQLADANQSAGRYDEAMQSYLRAAELAHDTGDRMIAARARVGVLEVGGTALAPSDHAATAYESQLRDAELAVQAAGSPLALTTALDEARSAHAAYVDGDLSKAIELEGRAVEARKAAGDTYRLPRAAAALAELLDVRSGDGDLERAARVLDGIGLGIADNARYWNAWLRGDVAAAHALFDDFEPLPRDDATPIAGRVVDERGTPVAGASVVVWSGELFGDPMRVFTDKRQNITAIATTDHDGRFAAVAPPDGGLIAELGARRSRPMPATPNVQLALGPTRTIAGTVDAGGDSVAGIEPFVRIDVAPGVTWFESIAPSRDGRFTLGGIPIGATVRLGAVGSHWPRETNRRIDAGPAVDGAIVHWPVGDTFDIDVPLDAQTAWVIRGTVHPATRADLAKLAPQDIVAVAPEPVGTNNVTAAGVDAYRPGAHHAIVRDNAPGPYTVCIGTKRDDAIRCMSATVASTKAPVRDGRRWFDGIAVFFAL